MSGSKLLFRLCCGRDGIVNAWPAVLSMVIALTLTTTPRYALALEEALARKCYQLALKSYPRSTPHAAYKPGDPVMARLRQAYYASCLAKKGEVE